VQSFTPIPVESGHSLRPNRKTGGINRCIFSLHFYSFQSQARLFFYKFKMFVRVNDSICGDSWLYFPKDMVFSQNHGQASQSLTFGGEPGCLEGIEAIALHFHFMLLHNRSISGIMVMWHKLKHQGSTHSTQCMLGDNLVHAQSSRKYYSRKSTWHDLLWYQIRDVKETVFWEWAESNPEHVRQEFSFGEGGYSPGGWMTPSKMYLWDEAPIGGLGNKVPQKLNQFADTV